MSVDDPQAAAPSQAAPQLRRHRIAPGAVAAPGSAVTSPPPGWPDGNAFMRRMLEEQRTRKRRLAIGLLVLCILPAILTFLYMLVIATPRYATKFEVTYQTYQPQQSLSSGLVQTVLGTSAGSTVDLSSLLYEYVRSPALLGLLDKQFHLRQHYSDSSVDLFSRLGRKASTESFLRYYHRHVLVAEGSGGYLTVTVTAFDPRYAVALANGIIRDSDVMVDSITGRARQDEVHSAELLVQKAEEQVRQSRQAMTAYENAHGDIDPQTSANQLNGIAGSLESQLATSRAELNDLQVNAPKSPHIPVLRTQIASVERQLGGERYRLANASGAGNYAQRLDEFSKLQIQQDFAKNAFMSAQNGLAVARADVAAKQNYLVDFAPPYAPDNQNLWLALIYGVTVLIASMLMFGLASVVYGAARG